MLVAVVASFLYVFDVSAAAKPHLFVNLGLAVLAVIVPLDKVHPVLEPSSVIATPRPELDVAVGV